MILGISMKKYLDSWNKFEIILFSLSILLIFGIGFILECELLSIIVSFLMLFTALNQAKGNILSQFIGVLVAILYSYISYNNRYYGETIIYVFILLPMYIIGIYTWSLNNGSLSTVVNKNEIGIKEWIILIMINILLFILMYFLLDYFDTEQLLISTLSMNINLTATYLLIRRSKYSFIIYLFNSIIFLFLWGIPVLNGDYKLLPMLLEAILLIVNDIYGTVRWMKR